jgi:predicted Co/Zn/Cd cation transporter (cation efflux family)
MKILLRIVALLCVLLAGFLIYAVIHALGSEGGARPAVAVLYVFISIVLGFVAVWLWRRPARPTTTPAA